MSGRKALGLLILAVALGCEDLVGGLFGEPPGPRAPVWYVKPGDTGDGLSWDSPMGHPQDAVDAARSGNEIWVAAGTYVGSGTFVVLGMKEGVSVYGGFAGTETSRDQRDPAANETILDGQDTSYHVVAGATNATLDGFTITRGNAGAPGPSPDSCGGGMQNWQVSDVVVANCRFVENQASWHGGGILNDRSTGIRITNCVFRDNTAGMCGGAIENNLASIEVTNCTFSGNSDGGTGGAIYNNIDTGNQSVRNCILWGDLGGEIQDGSGASTTVTYSCIQGGWAGTGNILSDPLFVNAGSGDLRLAAGSPCIDSADGDQAPATDIAGNARRDDTGTDDTGVGAVTYSDMGAHEFQGVSPSLVQVTSDAANIGIACWSPDGTKIAYMRPTASPPTCQLWVMDADGSNAAMIYDKARGTGDADTQPTGALDWHGDYIVFTKDENVPDSSDIEVWKIRYDGTGLTQLTFTLTNGIGGEGGQGSVVHGAVFSPDGTKIAFNAHHGTGWPDPYVCNSDGTDGYVLLQDLGHCDDIAWAPDGSRVIFAAAGSHNQVHTMYASNPDGTGDATLWSPVAYWTGYAYSPDGTLIAFLGGTMGTDTNLSVSTPDGSTQTTLLSDAFSEFLGHVYSGGSWVIYRHTLHDMWTPDSQWIVFTSDRSGNFDLWMICRDGSGLTQITTDPARDVAGQVSPDGTKVLFVSDRGGSWDLYVMPLVTP